MAPKKKSKKQDDDWEAELGESIAPVNDNAADAPPPAAADEDEPAAGGLMALLRKKKEKRKAKGLSEDFPAEEPQEEPAPVITAQAPIEANLDDEFALPEKKGKGGKGKQQNAKAAAAADDETDATGRVLTKAEKEKAKKEREKQRKKEQVSTVLTDKSKLLQFRAKEQS